MPFYDASENSGALPILSYGYANCAFKGFLACCINKDFGLWCVGFGLVYDFLLEFIDIFEFCLYSSMNCNTLFFECFLALIMVVASLFLRASVVNFLGLRIIQDDAWSDYAC